MSTIAISRNIQDVTAGEAYEALLSELPELEYVIWKTRPLAWLAIANRELPQGRVNATLSIRPGDGAVLTISLSCDTMQESALQMEADALASAILSLLA